MEPCGERGYPTAQAAHDAAKAQKIPAFAVISHPRQAEFAWVAPLEFFMSRMPAAMMAGIQIMEMSK